MSEVLLVGLITVGGSLAVCFINNIFQNKKVITEIKTEIKIGNELQAYKIEELDKKVEKHNKVIERVFLLEKADEVEKEQIKVINHRIEDLESYHK